MNPEALLFLVATGVAMIAAVVLVFFKDFDDRVLGRLGLVCMIFACAAVLHDFYASGQAFVWARSALLFTIGAGLFLTRMCLAHFNWWRERRKQPDHRRRRGDGRALF